MFKERCRRAVTDGWWHHPLAKVLRRRSRKLLGLRARQAFAFGGATADARKSVKTGSWLVGAIYAMSANGLLDSTIAQEVGISRGDVRARPEPGRTRSRAASGRPNLSEAPMIEQDGWGDGLS